ncbi:MAG TPA: PDZ domain-containing protein [Arenicellales bacterium]|nr:PDZ domain-containing protein [Arenicellales bacterium]
MKRLLIILTSVIFLAGCANVFYQPERSRKWPDLGVRIAVVAVPGDNGVLARRDFVIRTVRPQTPAAFGGLQVGDVLLSMDGQIIDAVSVALDVMRSKSKFDTVLIVVERAGEERQLLISLANADMRSDI